jgi:high-affinity nickel permease
LASFFSLIPAGPAYAGTFDTATAFGLKALSITGGAAVSFAILVRAVLFVPITIAGLVLVLARDGGLRTLRRSQEPAAASAETRRSL